MEKNNTPKKDYKVVLLTFLSAFLLVTSLVSQAFAGYLLIDGGYYVTRGEVLMALLISWGSCAIVILILTSNIWRKGIEPEDL